MSGIWIAVLSVVFAVLAAWVSRHVLGTRIGWVRAIIVGIIVYLAIAPVMAHILEWADVIEGDAFQVNRPIAIVFLALAIGWQFAIVVTAIMLLELLWPSGRGFHPIRAVREGLRRRNRLRRYTQILRISGRHGIDLYRQRRHGDDQDIPMAVVAAMNEAGPTFIKIGQVLSTRDDILPREFTDAFASLQMNTAPLPWDQARAAIEAELGMPIDQVFGEVDEEPLAAASLAQVHTARLVSGESVVIKIQRPEARALVEIDVDIIERLAADAERHAEWARGYGVRALATEFVRALREELDYRIEVANTELVRGTLSRSTTKAVRVPVVYADYCTSRMVVQERIVGTPLSALDGTLPGGLTDDDPDAAHRIADEILDSVFEQIAVRGVFHADLHPGNLILQADGTVALIDFGSIGIVERSLRRLLTTLLMAMEAEDDIATTDIVLMMVSTPDDGSKLDKAAFQHEIGMMLTRVQNGRTDAGVFRELIDTMRRHRLALPPALLLIFRTLGSLEGTLRKLDPDYDLVKQALARAAHFARASIEPRQLATSAATQLQLATERLRRLPRRVDAIATQLEQGSFTMRLRTFADAAERGWVGGLVGQVTTAIVGIALVVVAVILVVSGGGPHLTEDVALYPFLGAALGLGGLLLVVRTLRVALSRRVSEGQG